MCLYSANICGKIETSLAGKDLQIRFWSFEPDIFRCIKITKTQRQQIVIYVQKM